MAIHRDMVDLYECDDCEKQWVPRDVGRISKQCPYCGSRHWNRSDKPDKEQDDARADEA